MGPPEKQSDDLHFLGLFDRHLVGCRCSVVGERPDSVQRIEAVEVGMTIERLVEGRRWQLCFVSVDAPRIIAKHSDLHGSLKMSGSGIARLEDGGKLHSGISADGRLKPRAGCS